MTTVTLGSGRGDTGRGGTGRADRVGACLERARSGDTAALGEIVRELNPLLWHVARAEGLTTEEAADVVQTTWLELVRRLHDIRSSRAVTSWLVTAARREAWRVGELFRRRGPDGGGQLGQVPPPHPG